MKYYVSMGAIEEKKIEELAAMTTLIDRIAKKNSELGFDIKKDFPHLFWVLRDFTLDLQTNTAQDYLDRCLEELDTTVQVNNQKNKMRKAIKQYFSNRTCIAFGRPASEEKILRNIDNEAQISSEFKEEVENMLQMITLYIGPKTANKNLLTGKIFFEFLQTVVDSINSGEIPMIEGTVERLLSNEANEKTKRITQLTCKRIERLKEIMPISEKDLIKKYNDIVFEELDTLRDHLHYISSKDMYRKSMKTYIDSVSDTFNIIYEHNVNNIHQSTNNILTTISSALMNLPDNSTLSSHILSLLDSGLYDHRLIVASTLGYIDTWLIYNREQRDFKKREQETEWENERSQWKEREERAKIRESEKEDECRELRREVESIKARIEHDKNYKERELDAKKSEIIMLKERLDREREKYEKERDNLMAYKNVIS